MKHKFLKHIINFIGIALLLISCQPKLDVPISQTIHNNWEFKGKDTLTWQKATVPGNVFTDLLETKTIPDPFILSNEKDVQWVSEKDWTYRTTFELSDEIPSQDHIELHFGGLDTYTKITLNDSILGRTNNAFRKWKYDIKDLLSDSNNLTIDFKNFNEIESEKEEKNPYQLPGGLRVYTRKAQFQYGWDWGPVLNTMGIWKPVKLISWTDAFLRDVYIRQDSLTTNFAFLTTEFTIESDIEEKSELKVQVDGQTITSEVQLKKGTHSYSLPVAINDPKLWWTHNLGEPHQYDFKVQLKIGNKIKEQKSIKKGIRTIELITEKDGIGESFYFKLNGTPVYMKGTNYIPMHSFQNRITSEKYQKLLSDVVDANMNMLRVWGGGIYETDEFYELCDEKGILIWQDFMFACAMYPGDGEFLANVRIEAVEQVKRLRNHASIALWCGNNENSEGWHRWGWQANRTEQEKKDIWNDYLAIFDTILPNVVKTHSTTDYWESSPKYGRGNPKYKTEGDAHDWWIWHDAYPFEHLEENVPRFMSEFGFQSFPSYPVIQYLNQKDSIDLHTEAIRSHQKHSRGFRLINEYMKRDYTIPDNDEDYAYVSQLLQAKGMIMGIEAQRRSRPHNMGTLYWQLNDVWPAISWSSIDYFGNWKAFHYKAKKAFDNVLISTKETKYSYDTYIVNDSLSDIQGTLKLKIIDFKGNEIWSNSKEIKLAAISSQKVYSIPTVDIYKAGYAYIIEFKNRKSFYYFDKPKKLKLPEGNIEQRIEKVKDGFTIHLKSNVLQKDVFLYTSNKGHFSDNFFDLEPNIEKKITFKTASTNLDSVKIKTLYDSKN